jgi:hypothetical protein
MPPSPNYNLAAPQKLPSVLSDQRGRTLPTGVPPSDFARQIIRPKPPDRKTRWLLTRREHIAWVTVASHIAQEVTTPSCGFVL